MVAREGRVKVLDFSLAYYPFAKTMETLDRITTDPQVMGGKPCIRGLRVTVGTVVGLVAAGKTVGEILRLYPYLEEPDIPQALAHGQVRAAR